MGATNRVQKPVLLGLGDAIDRREQLRQGLQNALSEDPSRDRRELALLTEALNEHKLNLGLDCDGDGLPDTEDALPLLTKSAEDDCCSVVATQVERLKKEKVSSSRYGGRRRRR